MSSVIVVNCYNCDGQGKIYTCDGDWVRCGNCHGNGKDIVRRASWLRAFLERLRAKRRSRAHD